MPSSRPNPIDIHVGCQIKMRRKSLGMSQTMLGERLGITFQQVQKYEKGANRVGASRLQAIASYLGVEVAFFFSNAPGQHVSGSGTNATDIEGDAVRSFIGTNEGYALNRAFYGIKSPAVRQKIVGLVKALAKHADDER